MSALFSWLRHSRSARASGPSPIEVDGAVVDGAGVDPPDTAGLSLYQYPTCPFCVRVQRVLDTRGLDVELRDIRKEPTHYEELLRGGGKGQVPCLRVAGEDGNAEWIYESSDIIRFLEQRQEECQERCQEECLEERPP